MRTKKIFARNVSFKRGTFRIFLLLLIQQIVVVVTLARKTSAPVESQDIPVKASCCKLSENGTVYDGNKHIGLFNDNTASVPFRQTAVKQNKDTALKGSHAPNGVIHPLTATNLMCLDYEFNKARVWSDAGDITPENSGRAIKDYVELYPNGKLRSKWRALICPDIQYLLKGKQADYCKDGTKEHQVTRGNERMTGEEAFWSPYSAILRTWLRDLENNHAVWMHYGPIGNKKIESAWNTKPEARDLKRHFLGYVADGPSRQWDEQGNLLVTHIFEGGDQEWK
jgi:hypothetical protein